METTHDYVLPDRLRRGLYVDLELGWMSHPFPKSSFKITSERQIEIIRTLGLRRVRFIPSRSDPEEEALEPAVQIPVSPANDAADPIGAIAETPATRERREREQRLAVQRENLARCDRQFGEAMRQYEAITQRMHDAPAQAAALCDGHVSALVDEVLGAGESSIRLLSEGMGDQTGMHPVNVTVLSLLLGRAIGLERAALRDLGMAALLHDIGKVMVPDRVRWLDRHASAEDRRAYEDHVAHGVSLARGLALPGEVLRAIGEHHEAADGHGFPRHIQGEAISVAGRVLALVNCYENQCNPSRPAAAVTPHEALSLIYAQMRPRFDAKVLAAFIRMMGVYPPGSVVQLSTEQFALVVSVNSSRPLKPSVIVHDPSLPSSEALILDLEAAGSPSIRRSVRPSALPKAAIDYLSPRSRICYFFERSVVPASIGGAR